MEYSEREWKLMQEVEKLKTKVKKQSVEIADLKSQKKTLQNKLKIANEFIEDLKKNNKTNENEKLKLDISVLTSKIKTLTQELAQSNKIVDNLKVRINKDSSNSSKPSSTDCIYTKKIHNNTNRKKGGKTGGQFGHKGRTLSEEYVKTLIKNGKVKHIIKDIGNVKNPNYKSKFICDIEITTVVTEYRYHADKNNKYNIPTKMLPVVQYGPYSKSLMTYITNELMCPLNKTATFMQCLSMGKYKFSEGTVVNTQKTIDKLLEPIVEKIKQKLIEVKILHADETGIRVNGELKWLHTYCSKNLFYYEGHDKRGTEAIEDIGIIEFFTNILVHDHWKSYYTKGAHITHAECNAHILRYLKAVLDIIKLKDVEDLIKLFVKMNDEKKSLINRGKNAFSKTVIKSYEKEYDKLLLSWGKDLNKRISTVQDPKIYDDEKNLHDRLVEFKKEHLLFINNFEVPFDNNLGERALRTVKSKTNACGGFRTMEGLDRFARARSFIMTTKSRNENILNNLVHIFSGKEYELA